MRSLFVANRHYSISGWRKHGPPQPSLFMHYLDFEHLRSPFMPFALLGMLKRIKISPFQNAHFMIGTVTKLNKNRTLHTFSHICPQKIQTAFQACCVCMRWGACDIKQLTTI